MHWTFAFGVLCPLRPPPTTGCGQTRRAAPELWFERVPPTVPPALEYIGDWLVQPWMRLPLFLSMATLLRMDEVARLLNDMVRAGVIEGYAVFDAVAQMRYTETVATLDADILVAVPEPDALDVLSPIYSFCLERGYRSEGEAIRVGDWPAQFIPTFNPLTEAALEEAETGDLDGTPLRVVQASDLAAIALSVGRAKDFARILALREAKAVTDEQITTLAARYNLTSAWQTFLERFDEG